MSNAAPSPQDPASPASDDAPDPAILRAERRLRLLEELAEIGMELARALRPGAPADQACEEAATAKGRDPADAFARLSRAIRLTLALEARTDAELRDLKAGIVREREEKRAKAAERAEVAAAQDRQAREWRVRDLVLIAAEAEIEDGDEYIKFCEAFDERLAEDEAYEDYAERPLRETVERLCKDLALTPDWSRWDVEGWIDEPERSRFSPFSEPSATPYLE